MQTDSKAASHPQKRSWLYRLVNTEIPDLPNKIGWAERTFLVGFIILFSFTFVQTYPTVFLGFGLGDEFEWATIFSYFETIHAQSPLLFYFALGALLVNVLFRMQIFLRGQLAYRTNDPALPMKTVALFMATNILNIVFVAGTVSSLGLLFLWMGFDFNLGFKAVENLYLLGSHYANQVPTLWELPLIAAFFLTYMVQGFFHYWIHRLCHLNRFLWLTLHRLHHMPPTLTAATTTVVITSVPFFLGLVLVKTFIFGSISKFFYAEPLFMEMFFFHFIMSFTEPYGHQSALFKEGIKSRWTSKMCFLTTNGVYHYLHHSRDAEIVGSNKTNQVNIGGGIAYFWDHVFGTFKGLPAVKDPKPQVGLWGNPDLHHNPIRLLMSGLVQIVYEVYHNPGFKTKLMCIIGSVRYSPPITRSFHVREPQERAINSNLINTNSF